MFAFPTEFIEDEKKHTASINVSCKDFLNGEMIPAKYTCDGQNVNPPLTIGMLPDETQSLVLIVQDPDAQVNTWVHWLVWNIVPTHKIAVNSVPGMQGINSFGVPGYCGPCPPAYGTHRYFFRVYALNAFLKLPAEATKETIEKAVSKHIVGFGELIGLYKRK